MSVDVTLHDVQKIEVSEPRPLTTSDTTLVMDIKITHEDWKSEEVMILTLFGTEEELKVVFEKDKEYPDE
tara:strand:- start:206 stop:415 length:210 start_codon:yes stop_codon:yes gene_type:complete